MANKKNKREFAVIGLGRFGSSLARRLEALGQAVLGIDLDPRRVKDIADEITEAVVLDAMDREALQQVDITAFETVIVAIAYDFEACALITSSLLTLGVPNVICQAGTNRHRDILMRIGAARVVIPPEEAGVQLADELSTPGMLERLSLSQDYSLIEILAAGRSIDRQVNQLEENGVNLLMVIRGGDIILIPEPDFKIIANDILVLVGEKRRLAEFSAKL